MKKLTLIAVFSIVVNFMVNAQTTHIGFTAGTSIANYKIKGDGITISFNSKIGIVAGVFADIPAGKNFSFQPALNFVQKGTKSEETFLGINSKEQQTINCIELPLNVLYNVESNTGTFFIGAGPSFAFAISGKWKSEEDGHSEKGDLKFGNDPDNDDLKGLDIGANILAGYRFPNGLLFSAGYNLGLNNLAPGGSDDGTLKSHYFGIKIGFLLKGKK